MQCRAVRLVLGALAVSIAGAGQVAAADHPVEGDRLVLRDKELKPERRRVTFRATRDLAIDPATSADPRLGGATLEVVGTGVGDGAAGPIALATGSWAGLGNPPGSRGYKWIDRTAPDGVKKVVFKGGKSGGSLIVTGGGAAWPFAVTQPQGPIDVRFTIGGDVWCAHFVDYQKNEPGKVTAKKAPAPPACGSVECGNGVVEGSEECDDGNTDGGDGCAADCQLENTTALCAGIPTVSGTALDSVRVASGLQRPLFLTAPPLDPARLFVVEQNGRVRIVKSGVLLPTPFLAIEGDVSCCGEQGLLGFAFHPDYETNGRFFVSYTAPSDGPSGCDDRGAGDNVIAEYQVSAGDPDHADVTTKTELVRIDQAFTNHNGGHIAFGPDGMLYFGVGDGGSGGDPCESGQDDASALGKLLRIDVDAPPASPVDAIVAKGLRNPWRFSFDRATGDLYLADVGQNLWEEVNVQAAPFTAGVNYGWDNMEGRHCFEPPLLCDQTGLTLPVLEYCHFQDDPACGTHPRGCSVTGGYVYRGCRMPDLHGHYFYSDFCGAFVRTFQGVSGGDAQNLVDRTADVAPGGGLSIDNVSSFGEDARGELYILDHGSGGLDGEVFKLVPEG